ncbi:MAG TPA: immunoglobulin-like domain-containing protein, partial [Bacteroidales bacterium]|nr:immunoglobulin-like domain-containing protein [Bacteroidales bacterium]
MKKFTLLIALMAFVGFSAFGQETISTSPPLDGGGSGTVTICKGGTVNLTVHGSKAGKDYYFAPGNGDNQGPTAGIGGNIGFSYTYNSSGTFNASVSGFNNPPPGGFINLAFTVKVEADPIAPTMTKDPIDESVCAGTNVSATIVAGSGGVSGCSDTYEYSTNGGSSWSTYTSGQSISTTDLSGTNIVQVKAWRAHPDGLGCMSEEVSVSWTVNPLPTLGSVTLTPVCAGNKATMTLTGLPLNVNGKASYVIKTGGGNFVFDGDIEDNTGEEGEVSYEIPIDLVVGYNGYVIQITKLEITATGCTKEFTNKNATVVVKAKPTATLDKTDATCYQDNGEIRITNPTGGFEDHEYSIGDGWQTSGTFSNLEPNTYVVSIRTTEAGCEKVIDNACEISNLAGPALAAVNAAGDKVAMQTALEDVHLCIDNYVDYNTLVSARKTAVAQDMLENRLAITGYESIVDVKTLFDDLVTFRLAVQVAVDNANNGDFTFQNLQAVKDAWAKFEDMKINGVVTSHQNLADLQTFIDALGNMVSGRFTALRTDLKDNGAYGSFTNMYGMLTKLADFRFAVGKAVDHANTGNFEIADLQAVYTALIPLKNGGKLINGNTIPEDFYGIPALVTDLEELVSGRFDALVADLAANAPVPGGYPSFTNMYGMLTKLADFRFAAAIAVTNANNGDFIVQDLTDVNAALGLLVGKSVSGHIIELTEIQAANAFIIELNNMVSGRFTALVADLKANGVYGSFTQMSTMLYPLAQFRFAAAIAVSHANSGDFIVQDLTDVNTALGLLVGKSVSGHLIDETEIQDAQIFIDYLGALNTAAPGRFAALVADLKANGSYGSFEQMSGMLYLLANVRFTIQDVMTAVVNPGGLTAADFSSSTGKMVLVGDAFCALPTGTSISGEVVTCAEVNAAFAFFNAMDTPTKDFILADVNGKTYGSFTQLLLAIQATYNALPVVNISTTPNLRYATIQGAIDSDETTDGHTITVASGTYTENVTINKPNLTLKSVDGRDVTFIKNPLVNLETPGISVVKNMGTVTVDGFTVDGFRLGINQSRANGVGTTFIVKNNKVIPENSIYMRTGIQVTGVASQVTGNYVVGAPLTNDWASTAIGVIDTKNVLVEDNTIDGPADLGINVMNVAVDYVENIIIKDNLVTDAGQSIRISGWPSTLTKEVKNITITGNTLKNSPISGGIVTQDVSLNGLTVTGNTITGHALHAVNFINDGTIVTELGGDIKIDNNTFGSNGSDIYNGTDHIIDATCNWWGTTDYSTIYDNVEGNVLYVPYLSEESATCTGSTAIPNNVTLTYTPANQGILLKFGVANNAMELRPAPGLEIDPFSTANLGEVGLRYQALADALAGSDEDAITAAALAIGDDIICEYYYMNGLTKVPLQTDNNNPLVKSKYWAGYLVKDDIANTNYPDWFYNPQLTLIEKGSSYRTHTNTGTVVGDGWLNAVLGREMSVDVTFINNGRIEMVTKTVPIDRGPVNVYNGDPAVSGIWVSSHTTIQDAISVSTTLDNYFVVADAGIYEELIIIDKPLTLRGPNFEKTGFDELRDPLSEAILTFPDGITVMEPALITVSSGVNNVTIEGFDIKDKDYLIGQIPYLIHTFKANDLTVRNNRMYGGDVQLYVLTGTAVADFRTGLLVEGNYMNSGPFVNSVLNRGIYVQATAGTVQNNQIVNANIGVQIMPYGHATGGEVKNNIISANEVGLYHNGQAKGAGTWTWSNNTVTIADNDHQGLKAQVKNPRPYMPKVIFNGICVTNFGSAGTGSAPAVFFTNNSFDGAKGINLHISGSMGVNLQASYGTGTVIVTENSFTNTTGRFIYNQANYDIQATCNWWGRTDVSNEFWLFGGAVYSPWLESAGTQNNPGFTPDAGSCGGTPVVIASAVADNITCGETTGSILVTFSGGTAPYTVAWGAFSATGVALSPYTLEGLAVGTNQIKVTDVYGNLATFSPAVAIQSLPVTLKDGSSNFKGYYATIQAAINAATAGDVIDVCAGTYEELIVIDKPLTLRGPNFGNTGYGTRVAEAILTFPDDLPVTVYPAVAAEPSVITVNANVHGVTIEGFTIQDKDYLIREIPYLIQTFKVNDLTVRNNRMFGSDAPLMILTNSTSIFQTGLLVEGNFMDCGPFVNSQYNRGMYIQATAGTIRNNQVLNTNVGIQILHYGNPTGGVVENNTVSAGAIGLYHNGHAKGAGSWTWSGNTVTSAENERTGLQAQVNLPQVFVGGEFRGIEMINFGVSGKGNAPVVNFNNNSIDGTIVSSPFVTSAEGLRVMNNYGTGTATLTGNSFTNVKYGIRNATTCNIQATCNWWGTDTYSGIYSKVSGPAVYVPYLTSNDLNGDCDGPHAKIAGLAINYTAASENVVVTFGLEDNSALIYPIPGLTDPGEIAAKYGVLAAAIATGVQADITAAALSIGDDIITEYYYKEGTTKKYLKTAGGNDLVKNKYYEGYLRNTSTTPSLGYPSFSPPMFEVPIGPYSTSTNPKTQGGTVNNGWLSAVYGKDLYVSVTLIHNGKVTNLEQSIFIPAAPIVNTTTGLGYMQIQTAIDASNSTISSPETIQLAANYTFLESDITINKDGLTLIGAGEEYTFINPDPAKIDGHDCTPTGGTVHHGIIVAADNVTIKDLTVDGGTLTQGYRQGITSYYWTNLNFINTTVQDVTVTNIFYRGIVLRRNNALTSGHKVLGATVTNGGCGNQSWAILGFNVDGFEVKGCYVENWYQGIGSGNYTGIPSTCDIQDNEVVDVTSQAYTLTSNDAVSTFKGNTATFNTANTGTGLVTYQDDMTLTDNTFTGAQVGISVGYQTLAKDKLVIGANNTITGLSPTLSGSVGILANDESWEGDARNFTVNGTTISDYETGILIKPENGMTCSADILNNTISASLAGISVNEIETSATSGLTITGNNVTLTNQLSGVNPTIGISLSKVTGTAAAVIIGNTLANSFYGYLVYNLNTSPATTITGGTIKGIMQGVAAVNLDPAGLVERAPSNLGVSNMTVSDFAGAHAGSFHAGVYVYTGGAVDNTSITATVDKVSVTGTGKIQQDCAGLSFADFSTLASAGQNITVTECTLTGNLNRGINVRGANALVDLGTSTLTGNGSDPYVTGGNNGFGIMAHTNANVNVHNCFITNPASTINPVYALFANGAIITAIHNYLDNNGNTTMGKIAVSQGVGSITATCNWWGSTVPATNAALISGSVTYQPWLTSGADGAGAGFQPQAACDFDAPVGGLLTMTTKLQGSLTATQLGNVYTITEPVAFNGIDVLQVFSIEVTDANLNTDNVPVFFPAPEGENGYMEYDAVNLIWNYVPGNPIPEFVEGEQTITATFSDLAGNSTLLSVILTADTEAPVITLLGDANVSLCKGDTYEDAGATAADVHDGSLTGSIVVTGLPIAVNTPGTYTITYNVSDAAGNPAIEVTREVIVHELPTATISGNQSICNGFTATLSVVFTGAALFDFTYSDGIEEVTLTGIPAIPSPYTFDVNPTANTTYTITNVTDANGCENVGTGNAKVYLGPTTIASDVVACANSVIEIPITVKNFNDVSAVSLTMLYSATVMTFKFKYDEYEDLVPDYTTNYPQLIKDVFVTESGADGKVIVVGTSNTPLDIADGETLLTLNFDYEIGDTKLVFDDRGGNSNDDSFCEYGNGIPGQNYLPFCDGNFPGTWPGIYPAFADPAYYVNGLIEEETTPPVLIDFDVTCASLDKENLNQCLSEAIAFDPSTLNDDVADLYEDNCNGIVTAEWTGTTPGTNDDCNWEFTYAFKIKDVSGNFVTCDVVYSGGDLVAPALTDIWPTDITDVNNCVANVPAEPTDVEIAALYEDACGGV